MMPKHNTCEPASSIIALLGGEHVVASYLRISPSTVYRWTYHPSSAAQGTGGYIPRWDRAALVRLAESQGVLLTDGDFVACCPVSRIELPRQRRGQRRMRQEVVAQNPQTGRAAMTYSCRPLTSGDQQLIRGMAFLPDSKTGKKIHYLPPAALHILSALPKIAGNPYVFPSAQGWPIRDLQGPWKTLRSRPIKALTETEIVAWIAARTAAHKLDPA
jgi:hypothetical protein